MAKSKFEIFMGNMRNKITSYQKQGMDIFFSATFVTGKEKEKLVDRASADLLYLVAKNLKFGNPDKIHFDLYNGKEAANSIWPKEFVFKEPELAQTGFQGLGEVEINRMVDERFSQRKQQAEYEELKERVQELFQENEELQDSINQLENRNTQLEEELESKKQIRYYTGMLGDILESFGIAKDRIKRPIAELMGITDGDEKPKQIEARATDQSGIVDVPGKSMAQSSEEQKRGEIISLISEYLKNTSNQTLANVFSIFSEIEADNSIADKIIQFVTTLKAKEHDNV